MDKFSIKTSQINTYFKHKFLINLDKRADRLKEARQELQRINIANVIRFPAVHLESETISRYELNCLGCTRSHLDLINMAKANRYDNILIFEDDILAAPYFGKYVDHIVSELKTLKWDMFYFYSSGEFFKPKLGNFVTKYITRVKGQLLTHCYAVNNSCYDRLSNLITGMLNRTDVTPRDKLIDVIYTQWILPDIKIYSCIPSLIFQRQDFSDIDNMFKTGATTGAWWHRPPADQWSKMKFGDSTGKW